MTSDAIGDINDAQGRELVDIDSQPLGTIREIFLDETTGRPAWAAVDAPGGGDDLVLAPLAHSTREGDVLRVAVTRERVETSPSTTGLTERFSADHMDRVRAHYADRPAATATAAAAADIDAPHDTALTGELPAAMTRSEEELFVRHERVPRERVRLVKRIVTETITQTIEVRREELQLQRVAISGSGDGGAYNEPPGFGVTTGDTTTVGAGATSPEGVAASVGNTYAQGTGSTGGASGSTGGAGGLSALRARASSLVGKANERFGGGPGFGEAFTNETLDLTLYEERVVVSKRVVPRERVRIHREVVTEQQRISDELRKEQIEVERVALGSETRVEGSGYGADAGR